MEPIQDRVFLHKRVPLTRAAPESPDWVPAPPDSWAMLSAPVSGAPVSAMPAAGSVSAPPYAAGVPTSAVPASAPPLPGGPGWVRAVAPSGGVGSGSGSDGDPAPDGASPAASTTGVGPSAGGASSLGFVAPDSAPVESSAPGAASTGGAGSSAPAGQPAGTAAGGTPSGPGPSGPSGTVRPASAPAGQITAGPTPVGAATTAGPGGATPPAPPGPLPPKSGPARPGYPAQPVSGGMPAYPGQPVSAGTPAYPGRPVTAPPAPPRLMMPAGIRPGFLTRHWPEPADPTPTAVAGVGLIGATAALFLRFQAGPSVGWLIVGLVAAACVLASRRAAVRASGESGWSPSPRALWAVAAVALLSVGTVRAAGWLFALCVPLAVVCASVAVAGGRTARTLLLTAFSTPFAGFRGAPWFVRGASREMGRSTGSHSLRMAAAIGVTLALVVVFGGLFAAADPAFEALVDKLVPEVDPSGFFGAGWRFVIFAWGGLGAVYLASRPPTLDAVEPGERKPVRRVEWLLPAVVLDGVFVTFVAVQFGAWFGRDDYVRRTAGLTYAEYARHGFWQLSAISVLTLVVLAVAVRKAPRENRGDRIAIRAALGTLTALSLVVVGSALLRMHVYEQAYGLTRLRLLVAVCEVAIGIVFVMVLVAGIRLNGAWLPRAVLGTAVVALLSLAALNPDRLIADRNIGRYQAHPERRLDIYYLGSLSADAAPAFDRLPKAYRDCVLSGIELSLSLEPDAWYEFNFGRAEARRLDPAGNAANCYSLR
ncbi:hypothetical protein Val02_83780 [Virgisporangium aliadipatigenens]|uniref:DUF4173 domain-containing protein n=1 Tax=Virgisporangium aliadipatigenens TaxID=741659 RepID=A0A8J4DWW1_9ACTN|nr:DUF4173 domain-containing protein [Virgisporangium aliadipatigenens]GIJ51492.1 hypothetical protein Val02_83780 [Virgisporangium aliadipatigenens]